MLVLAGSGPERERLARLAGDLGVRLVLLPDVPWERIVERYAVADVFALLSRHEPWGVVVNEAAACGLPLVLSERVGRRFDLLEDRRNGAFVAADDVAPPREAIRDSPPIPSGGRRGRGLARDRRGLGLRAEHREPGPGRPARRRASGAERLLVERELRLDDGVPGRSRRGRSAPSASARAKRSVPRTRAIA